MNCSSYCIEIYICSLTDLIVGAPYEGPGAIYVYLGSPGGIGQRHSQRISAEGVHGPTGKPLSGFGISISRGVDVDNNLYPGELPGKCVKSPFNVNFSHYMGLDGAHTQLGAGEVTHALHLRPDALPDVTVTCWQPAISA